jgi:GTP-binding protein YchF
VGLPNAGKSTIFNALTNGSSPVAAYPFCTIEPKEGLVAVPDCRLERLAQLGRPEKVTPTTLTFVDIAGLVKGAHQGEGLGNRFLSHIREVEAVAHVVRLFDTGQVSHVHDTVDPVRDFDVVMTELMLADLDTVQKRGDKCERMAKVGDKEAKRQLDLLHRLEASLGRGIPANRVGVRDQKEEELFKELWFLTAKPTLVVANLSEAQMAEQETLLGPLRAHVADLGHPVVPICGKLEMELAELPAAERTDFMKELGLGKLGLSALIEEGYRLLGLVTFYTTVGPELRAWTVRRATKAPAAAGRIHTDMEKGFIKAEIMRFEDLSAAGSEQAVRKSGQVRVEGKDYEMQDGDVVYFHFRA